MAFIDALIVLAFVAYAIGSGLRSRKKAGENLTEYLLAGRTLPGWKAGLSMAATQFAADTPLLVTGIVATAGVFALYRLWIFAVAFFLLAFLLSPCWRRAEVLTDAALSELRYGARAAALLRALKAVYFGLLFNTAVLAWVLFAAVRLAEPFLIWEEWLPAPVFSALVELVERIGVPLVAGAADEAVWSRTASNLVSVVALVAFTTLYSMTGGLRSVVQTDVMQLALMLVGTAVFAYLVVERAGGLDAMLAGLDARLEAEPAINLDARQMLAFDPTQARYATPALLTLFAMQWLAQVNADGTGYLAQRVMACRSGRDARIAAVVFTWVQVLLRSLLWLPLAIGLFVLFPPTGELEGMALVADREATYVRGLATLLPPGARGLLVTAMLAALASTIDTHLNWGASYLAHDLYGRFLCRGWLRREPSARGLVWVARGANLLVVTLALALLARLESIAHAWTTSLLFGAGVGGVLVLRWLWWRVTARAELVALATSLVLAPLSLALVVPSGDAVSFFGAWRIGAADPAIAAEAYRLLLVAFGSTLAAVLVARFGPPESMEHLTRFYVRVRPPGFWGPVAVASGEDLAIPRRRLARGALAIALATASLFAALVGLGTLMLGSPTPRSLPEGAWWPIALLVISACLVPLWWRLGVGPREEGEDDEP